MTGAVCWPFVHFLVSPACILSFALGVTCTTGRLAPAETRGGLQVWKGLEPAQVDQHLKVVAVIYDDGTHIGVAPDPAYKGADVIVEIFEARKGRADEWAKWH
jgi:hypothetical protein